MTQTGTIKNVLLTKYFGFIRPDSGPPDVFFYYQSLEGLDFDEQLQERRVEFETTVDERGRLKARVVRPFDGIPAKAKGNRA